MAHKDKTLEEQICQAADEGNIEFAESFDIDNYEDIAHNFLKVVFDIEYNECFISDESSLSDFAGCCVPEGYEPVGIDKNSRYADLNKVGKENMVQIINDQFGIIVAPNDYLITVFEKIQQKRNAKLN